MSKILVIAAHPDDEVLGLGATIHKLSKTNEVYILIVTEGCSSQYRGQNVAPIIAEKKEMAKKAAEILGAKGVLFGDLPDMKLDTVPHIEVNAVIEKAVDEIKPEIVFTHHFGDVNLDHQMCYRSTLVATRPSVSTTVKKLYTYEVLSATEWQSATTAHAFVPNTYVELCEECLKAKIDALKVYSMELRQFPHTRSEEAIRNLAAYRGQSVGKAAAEAFCLHREVL